MVNACEIKNGQLFNCHGTRNLKIANQYADAFTIVRELDTFSACDQIFTISQLRVRRSQQNLMCANWRVHWYLRVYVYVCIYLFFIFAIAVSASARLTNIRNAPINELVIALGLICLARCDFGFGFDFDFTIAACFIVFANRIATAAAARIGRECGCGYACARVFIVGLMSCSALGSSRWRVDWSSDTVGIRATIYDHLWATSTAASLGYWAANACSSQQWLDAVASALCCMQLAVFHFRAYMDACPPLVFRFDVLFQIFFALQLRFILLARRCYHVASSVLIVSMRYGALVCMYVLLCATDICM